MTLEPCLSSPQHIGPVLLGGVRRLFLRVIRWRRQQRQSTVTLTWAPCSAKRAFSSGRVISGVSARVARIRSAWASVRRESRSPPCGLGRGPRRSENRAASGPQCRFGVAPTTEVMEFHGVCGIMNEGVCLMEWLMKTLMLTLSLLVIGLMSAPGAALATPMGAAASVAGDVPSNLQEAYLACRWGPYGRRCWRVRPYDRPYGYYRPYYRPYYGYGYGY